MNGDAASDAVLALVTGVVAWRLAPARPEVALGAALVCAAASLGTMAFLGVGWAQGAPHHAASLVAGCAGLPLVALGLRWPRALVATRGWDAIGLALLLSLLAWLFNQALPSARWPQVVPLAAVLLIAVAGLHWRNGPVAAAGLMLSLALVAFAGGWTFPGLGGLQQLHLAMAAGRGLAGIGARGDLAVRRPMGDGG